MRKNDKFCGLATIFLNAVLPPGRDLLCTHGLARAPGESCMSEVEGDACCSHIIRARRIVERHAAEHAPPQTVLVNVFFELLDGDVVCPHIGAWIRTVIRSASDDVENHLPHCGHSDALRALVLWGAQKRRRLDEHLKEKVGSDVRREQLADTVYAWSRATGTGTKKDMWRIVNTHLANYLAACQEQFSKTRHVKMVLDGARIGFPKQEMILSCVEDLASGKACWAPPQVPPITTVGLKHCPFDSTCALSSPFCFLP